MLSQVRYAHNLLTDIEMGVRSGTGAIFVLSGVHKLEDLNGDQTADVGDVVYTTENQKPFDNLFAVYLYHVINVDTKKQIIVSEDNIERVKF